MAKELCKTNKKTDKMPAFEQANHRKRNTDSPSQNDA